jgi:hypothetical protein
VIRHYAFLSFISLQERERAAKSHKGPFLVVMRPQSSSSSSPRKHQQWQQQHPEGIVRLAQDEQQQQQQGGDGVELLEPVPLPLGSVRVSLGAYSTFEDCYALVSTAGVWCRCSYMRADWQDCIQTCRTAMHW